MITHPNTVGRQLRGPRRFPIERPEILAFMPHAPGWVLVDRILAYEPPERIITQKQVCGTDPFVAGHFQGGPAIIPGVLLVEYVSQSAYLLGQMEASELGQPPSVRLLARCNASFLSAASAGDILTAEVALEDRVRDVTVYEGVVRCGSRLVCRVKVYGAVPRDDSSASAVAPGGEVQA